MINKRKVVLVGTGFVGMSFAYSLLNQGGINELVLIDILKDKVIGEAMDLSHGMTCAPNSVNIKAGDYEDCKDANIVVITAGLNQKPGQTRLDLAKANSEIMKQITESVMQSGFNGIFVIASNPVDIMTEVVYKVSGFPRHKVIGSGTILDTARLRYLMGEKFDICSKNVHAYVLGEHGDSSFVPWEHSYIGCKNIVEIYKERNEKLTELEEIYTEVQQAAYEIINRKKATYYGIGMALTNLVKAILNDENTILTVSTLLNGEYKNKDIFIGVPAIINHKGVNKILELKLNKEDQRKFDYSCEKLNEIKKSLINIF